MLAWISRSLLNNSWREGIILILRIVSEQSSGVGAVKLTKQTPQG